MTSFVSSSPTINNITGDFYNAGELYTSNLFIPNVGNTAYQQVTNVLSSAANAVDLASSQIVTAQKVVRSSLIWQTAGKVLQVGNTATMAANDASANAGIVSHNNNVNFQQNALANNVVTFNGSLLAKGNVFVQTAACSTAFPPKFTSVGGSSTIYYCCVHAGLVQLTTTGNCLACPTLVSASNLYASVGGNAALGNAGYLYSAYNLLVNVSTKPTLLLPDPVASLNGVSITLFRSGAGGNAVVLQNCSYPAAFGSCAQLNAFLNTAGNSLGNVVLGNVGLNANSYWSRAAFVCVPNPDDASSISGIPLSGTSVAPQLVSTATTTTATSSSTSVTLSATPAAGISNNQMVILPGGTTYVTVVAYNSGTKLLTLSAASTLAASAPLSFYNYPPNQFVQVPTVSSTTALTTGSTTSSTSVSITAPNANILVGAAVTCPAAGIASGTTTVTAISGTTLTLSTAASIPAGVVLSFSSPGTYTTAATSTTALSISTGTAALAIAVGQLVMWSGMPPPNPAVLSTCITVAAVTATSLTLSYAGGTIPSNTQLLFYAYSPFQTSYVWNQYMYQ